MAVVAFHAPQNGACQYLRFVVGTDAENPQNLSGVFCAASEIRDSGKLPEYEVAWLDELFMWFSGHLPCPPFCERLHSGQWTCNAVCWYRADAHALLSRMWDLVSVLRENHLPVRLLRTASPGTIVYRDEYQIVAERYSGPRFVRLRHRLAAR